MCDARRHFRYAQVMQSSKCVALKKKKKLRHYFFEKDVSHDKCKILFKNYNSIALSLSLRIYVIQCKYSTMFFLLFLFSCVIWFVLYRIYCSIVSEENIKVVRTCDTRSVPNEFCKSLRGSRQDSLTKRREIRGVGDAWGTTPASTSMTGKISQSIQSVSRARLSRDLKIRGIDGIITCT